MTARTLHQPLPAERHVRRPRRALRIAVIGGGIVLGLCLILVALAWRASNAAMEGPPAHYPWSLASYPALARVSEPITVHSRTGVTLVGRFFPGRYGATVVLSHGYGGDQDEMLPVANTLHAAGLSVVTYDERGRGGSGGQGTWGALEAQDLGSVINAVARHPGVDPNEIGEFGFSIGADISIMNASADRRIKAVVAAGSWPSLQGYMKSSLIDVIRRPTWMFSPLALKLLELRTGADLDQVRPGAVIARISPRPILLIEGLSDTDVTPHDAVVNFDLARSPKQLWLVKGEGHEDMVRPGGAATSARVSAFFTRALLPSHA
jgi:uncharacterized protein